MAGIGFELRRLLRQEGYAGLLRAYGFAGVVSSGPWLLSIIAILLTGLGGRGGGVAVRFQVSVTYLLMASLLLTAPLQLPLVRYTADRTYEGRRERIAAVLMSAVLVNVLLALLCGGALALFWLKGELSYRLLMVACLVVLCAEWPVVLLLSSLKAYGRVVAAFAVGYGVTVVASRLLWPFGVSGLLLGFWGGQALLLFLLLAAALRELPGEGTLDFTWLRALRSYPCLALCGLCYNLAVWADKLLFWVAPATSVSVLGPLRVSVIYDLPVALAYLTVVPGMAVFLVRVETDFAESYHLFFEAVREGAPLARIEAHKDALVRAVREGFFDLLKVQGLTLVGVLQLGPALLRLLGISPLYIHLFYVHATAAAVQVLLMAILNVFFYLDRRWTALLSLVALFLFTNVALTAASQRLGPPYYGYGVATALLISSLVGLAKLSRVLDRLEQDTFMGCAA